MQLGPNKGHYFSDFFVLQREQDVRVQALSVLLMSSAY